MLKRKMGSPFDGISSRRTNSYPRVAVQLSPSRPQPPGSKESTSERSVPRTVVPDFSQCSTPVRDGVRYRSPKRVCRVRRRSLSGVPKSRVPTEEPKSTERHACLEHAVS